MSQVLSVLVVGAGPVGHALAAGLDEAEGLALRHWSRSRGPLWQEGPVQSRGPADVVVLAVRDDVIPQAALFVVDHGAAGPGTVLLHCAGALPPEEVFAGQRAWVGGCGMLHPLRSLSGTAEPADLSGTVMALCGDDAGLKAAGRLVAALGGVPLLLAKEQLGAYHAAASLAAGHVAALLGAAVGVLVEIGLSREHAEQALGALCRSVGDNVAALGLPAALTGPVARGDVATVARHLFALPAVSPAAADLYRAVLPAVLRLAGEKGAAAPEDLAKIAALAGPIQAGTDEG